ncbi:MAG: 30S ribosomal protein S2 [Bacteriovoracaceae bacterium]
MVSESKAANAANATLIPELTIPQLLEAGSHFGHQTHKWNPRMKKYVYGERNGIYIIDLSKTVPLAKKAYNFLRDTAASGKGVLFVGTKRQASEILRKTAEESGSSHVTYRWLGGMLTNFKTIALSVDKLRKVEKMKENGDFFLLTKKEQSKIEKDMAKLEKNLGGIKNMRKLPGAMIVVDPSNEHTAVKEAQVLGIPVVALIDTNCDPTGIDYVVPANDDAIKSIKLFGDYFSKAILEGNAKAGNKGKDRDGGSRDYTLEKEIIEKYEHDIDLLLPEGEEEEV